MWFRKKGFTMVELLVVLIILGILVAVAAPMYFANTKRARSSEAVAMMGTIRQAERDHMINHPGQILTGTLGTTNPISALQVTAGVARYFSDSAYSVATTNLTAAPFNTVNAVDFVITADGGNTTACTGATPANCALKATEVNVGGQEYILEMDNSGTIYVSYDNGNTWSEW